MEIGPKDESVVDMVVPPKSKVVKAVEAGKVCLFVAVEQLAMKKGIARHKQMRKIKVEQRGTLKAGSTLIGITFIVPWRILVSQHNEPWHLANEAPKPPGFGSNSLAIWLPSLTKGLIFCQVFDNYFMVRT